MESTDHQDSNVNLSQTEIDARERMHLIVDTAYIILPYQQSNSIFVTTR